MSRILLPEQVLQPQASLLHKSLLFTIPLVTLKQIQWSARGNPCISRSRLLFMCTFVITAVKHSLPLMSPMIYWLFNYTEFFFLKTYTFISLACSDSMVLRVLNKQIPMCFFMLHVKISVKPISDDTSSKKCLSTEMYKKYTEAVHSCSSNVFHNVQ